jgi:hypothetical protein
VSYARAVVEEEWPLMHEGRTSPRAEELADELRSSIQYFEPRTEAEQALRSEGLTQLDDLDEARALRLLEVREGLPPIVWLVLVVGGVITVAVLDYPFNGDLGVGPEAFELVLRRIEGQ